MRATAFTLVLATACFDWTEHLDLAGSGSGATTGGPDASADYFVSLLGDDNNDGSRERPFRSITRGVQALQSGQTLRIFGGLYSEGCIGTEPSAADPITIASGTSWDEATVITNYPGEEVVFKTYNTCAFFFNNQEHYVIIDGIILEGLGNVDSDVRLLNVATGAHHIRFRNGEIRYSSALGVFTAPETQHVEVIGSAIHHNGSLLFAGDKPPGDTDFGGVRMSGANQLLESNQIYENLGHGAQFYSKPGITNDCIIRDNSFYGNSAWPEGKRYWPALFVATGSNNLVTSNRIDNEPIAISVRWGAMDTLIEGNTISNIRFYGIYVAPTTEGSAAGPGVIGTRLRNNTISNVGSHHVLLAEGGELAEDSGNTKN